MKAGWLLAGLFGLGLAAVTVASAPTVADAVPPPPYAPLAARPGLVLWRSPERSFVTAKTREGIDIAATLALAFGGALQVADASGPNYGALFPPHKSHRTGADIDAGYGLDTYPTPIASPTMDGFVAILSALAPRLAQVFTSEARLAEIQTIAAAHGWPLPKITPWPGHETHAHMRFAP